MDERLPDAPLPPAAATMPLDPELQKRLQWVQDEEDRRLSRARQVLRERRVLLPVLAVTVLAFPNFRVAKVQGHSMEPTFHTGDTLYLLKTYHTFSPLKVGDVVIIKRKHGNATGEEIVKRIVFMQNAQGNAPWPRLLETGRGPVPADVWFPQYTGGAATVPAGGIIVMGDNIMNSMDSRDFGPVNEYEIVGKVLNP